MVFSIVVGVSSELYAGWKVHIGSGAGQAAMIHRRNNETSVRVDLFVPHRSTSTTPSIISVGTFFSLNTVLWKMHIESGTGQAAEVAAVQRNSPPKQ